MGRFHNKVKSGCRTCKIRKVKCDEGRPACLRCVSNGRICEGYGIWGGGTNYNSSDAKSGPSDDLAGNSTILGPLSKSSNSTFPKIKVNSGDGDWVEWFHSRTLLKMQGPFALPFWDTLVVRASLQEPSIFHAVLALSSLHKKVSMGARDVGFVKAPDQLERFSLRHYNKAIGQLLQPHFVAHDKVSVRTALVACMLFTCLEFLSGRYRTGNHHLRSGMKLLPLIQDYNGSNRDPVDDWLIGMFTRVNLSALQLGQGYLTPSPYHTLIDQPVPFIFESLTQARDIVDRLLNNILYLREHPGDKPLAAQDRIKSDVAAWYAAYQASKPSLLASRLNPVPKLGYQLLFLNYPMVKIMADTCLREPGDEMVFDAHSADFLTMMTEATKFLALARRIYKMGDPVFKYEADDDVHFTADLCWCPHLFFTAIHCRVQSIRRRAIRLLGSLHTREGIWDSFMAASAAIEVMRIEEEEEAPSWPEEDEKDSLVLYKFTNVDYDTDTDGSLCSDAPVPLPPARRRVFDVRLIPSDASAKASLVCKRRSYSAACGYEVITREFEVMTTTVDERYRESLLPGKEKKVNKNCPPCFFCCC